MGVPGIRVANRGKLILGIGNSLRGDDGVGERVVRALENLGVASDTCRLMISHQWIPELVLAFSDVDRLIVIDASVAHSPGEIRLQRVGSRVKGSKAGAKHGNKLTSERIRKSCATGVDRQFGSHEWDIHRVLTLADLLGYSSPRACIWTIGVKSLEYDESLTPVVSRSVERLVRHLAKDHCWPR